MELILRQRLDRPGKAGRTNVFGDLHWAGGQRWKVPTDVKVLPAHWQPTKAKRIHTSAPDANVLNLRLSKLLTAVQGVFTAAEGAGRAEAEIEVTMRSVGGGGKRRKPAPESTGPAPLTPHDTWAEFAKRWKAENEHLLSASYLRGGS